MNTATTITEPNRSSGGAIVPETRVRPDAWAIMDPVRGQIRLGMAMSVGAAISGLGAMAALATTAHALLLETGKWPGGALLAVLLLTALSYVLRSHAFNQTHYAAFRLERVLRMQLSERLASVSLGYVQSQGAGALSKVIHDDVKALHVFVADSTPFYARAYATPVITLLALLWLDWRLALVALGVLAGGFGTLSLAMRNRQEMTRLYNSAREQVSAAIVEFVQAMPVVRTFDTGQATFGRYQRALEDYLAVVTRWYRETGFVARFSIAILSPLPTLLAIVAAGLWLGHAPGVDAVRWIAVLLLCTGMAEAMLPAMMLMHMIEKVKLSVARIQDVMNAPVLPVAAETVALPADSSIRFENVSFRYGKADALALEGVSFHARPGTVTALVGPSGAGKSTVAKLIPRFWDIDTGRILVGGVDIRSLDADTLMRQVAFVFQDTFLFADTIAGNIRLGVPDADDDAVEAAARAAQIHDFIMTLPQGYATQVGERGVFLSGGQRQRITIARAILQNRPILVLDEATAFADPENEAALIAALSVLMRGKTVIMVAHRLSTIRDADQILVFDHGHLSEQGKHDDLLASDGVYACLWRNYQTAQNWSLGHAEEEVQA
jgi:ATP-binding cassette, subfamily B, bacterial IrtA/YbtP